MGVGDFRLDGHKFYLTRAFFLVDTPSKLYSEYCFRDMIFLSEVETTGMLPVWLHPLPRSH